MTYWVKALITANVIMFVLTTAAPQLTEHLMLVPVLALSRPWTPLTYMFLHANFLHLFFNMLALFFLGPRLEAYLGGKHFISLYVVSGLMGAALSFFFTPNVAIVGASGAIYGVMLGFAYFWPRERILFFMFPVEARVMVAILTFMSLFGGFGASGDGTAHFAHLGGFVGGFVYLKWMDSASRAAHFQQQVASPTLQDGDLQRWLNIPRDGLHQVNREELDRVTQKIHSAGVGSLSAQEIAFLNRFSDR